ncbi:MAG: hydrogenase small subunit [Thermodesulfobacteriota bacterium]
MLSDYGITGLKPEMSRRDFIKGCTIAAAALGLSDTVVPEMVDAASSKNRPSVIWLHFQECTGCTESLLRVSHHDISRLLLELISLDYHETLMAAAGHAAEDILASTVEKHRGNYICVVEGAISTKDNGIYCKIGGRTAMEILEEVAPDSALLIAIGNCASFGGIQAAEPNPTGAVGVRDLIKHENLLNIPGCPPNPVSFLGSILHYMTFKFAPLSDRLKRPRFAYGRRIHDQCERRAHFDEGRYVEEFGDAGHRQGFCLYKVGCKGPSTYSNCPVVRFNGVDSWPVGVGHGCIGCTEPNFWDTMTPFYERLPGVSLPGGKGIIRSVDSVGKTMLGITGAAIGIHAATGIVRKLIKGKFGQDDENNQT